jgi:sensor histidine kinase regulating citrate/malate metabolism
MAKFTSGSAYATARDIGEGYVLVTERWFRGMAPTEINQLAHEIERYLRELRGAPTAVEETAVIQARNRKIQRLMAATAVLNLVRQRARS